MKRSIWLPVLALVLAALGAGNSWSKKNGVVLKCIGWGGIEETKIIQEAVAEFKKAHPGVEVQLQGAPYGEYITKILTQYSAGLAPDVMCVNAEQMISFASRDIFVDLKPYAAKDPSIRLKDFYPEAIAHYTYKGVLTALPRDIAPIAVIYYNKKKFDEAGLPYPKDSWTKEQFLETAQKLTKKDAKGKTIQYGFVDDYPNWGAWVNAYGGTWVDNERDPKRCTLDSPEAVAGVQFRSDLIHKYGVSPSPTFMAAMGGMDYSDIFAQGMAAMFHSGIWHTPKFRKFKDFSWDAVEFPKGAGGKRNFPLSAAGYGILKTSKNPELAYELVKFLAGEVGQKYMAATGLTQPAIKRLAKSPVFLDGQAPRSKGFLVNAVKHGHFQPLDPNINEWKAMVDSAMDRVWNDKADVVKSLTKVTKEINSKFYKK